jgi:hypothetical protein
MRITRRQIRQIIREEAKSTKKYDDDSALKGDQDELPDALQKGIIDKTVDEREEEEKKDESLMRITKRQLRAIIREAVEEILDAEETSEIEPEEDVWSGGENLHVDIDHAEAYGSDPVVDAPEMLTIVPEHRSGSGAHMARQKSSPMRSRASRDLVRIIRQQRRG